MPDQLWPHHADRRRLGSTLGDIAALVAEPATTEDAAVPSVLLVPGYTGSKEDFGTLLEPLAERGFRAVAVDQPGQYESPGTGNEQDYTVDRLGGVVADLVGQLGQAGPVVLLGHSFGGLVARAAVTVGNAEVAGLVLLCSGPGALPEGPRRQAVVAGDPVMRAVGPAALFDRAAAAGIPARSALQAFYRARFVASTGLLGMGTALLNEPDRITELAGLATDRRLPIAVIAGEADDAWSLPAQADMASRLGTTLRLIPGAAHSPALEAPESLLAELLPRLREWTAL